MSGPAAPPPTSGSVGAPGHVADSATPAHSSATAATAAAPAHPAATPAPSLPLQPTALPAATPHTAAAIDWSAPWLAALRGTGAPIAHAWAAGLPLPDVLNGAATPAPTPAAEDATGTTVSAASHHAAAKPASPAHGAVRPPSAPLRAPPRFVPQAELPAGQAYESFVHASGCVPTRENLHDFFNGLAWLHFPQAKRRLNVLQAGAIAQQAPGAPRGAVRDAITLLDESGALLCAPPPLWDALRARDWQRLFIALRPLWAQARLLPFGHALLEQLVQPRKTIVAHVLLGQAAIESIATADDWLARELSPQRLQAKPFTPLPVLGVPGWWAGNENFCFYDDSQAFRPPRAVRRP